jgi:hypothetical protein
VKLRPSPHRERDIKALENRALRRIFETNRDEATRVRKILFNEGICTHFTLHQLMRQLNQGG